jgi:hypothetical protein
MDISTKDINKNHILIPTNINELKPDIEIIINKNEQIIKKYLERHIYTSAISDSDKQKLDTIFAKHRKTILDAF